MFFNYEFFMIQFRFYTLYTLIKYGVFTNLNIHPAFPLSKQLKKGDKVLH